MNLINDIKEQKEYYYVNTKFNLNDLIIAVAFAMFATGFFGASFFLNTDIIFEICAILFLMPFAVFFVVRIIKLAITIQKMKSCTKKGATYYAKITDEIQGEKVFSLSNKYKEAALLDVPEEIYNIYPVAEFRKNGQVQKMISKFAVSNSYKTALANNDIVIKVYKDIFVIIEYHQINSAVNRYSKIKKPALSFDEMFAKEKNQRTTAIKTLIIIAAAEAALLLLRLSHCFLL